MWETCQVSGGHEFAESLTWWPRKRLSTSFLGEGWLFCWFIHLTHKVRSLGRKEGKGPILHFRAGAFQTEKKETEKKKPKNPKTGG